MKVIRWSWREIDRISLVVALVVFAVVVIADQTFVGFFGMVALIGLWCVCDMIRAKEKEAGEKYFTININFYHLLLLVGLIAMSLLVSVVLG